MLARRPRAALCPPRTLGEPSSSNSEAFRNPRNIEKGIYAGVILGISIVMLVGVAKLAYLAAVSLVGPPRRPRVTPPPARPPRQLRRRPRSGLVWLNR